MNWPLQMVINTSDKMPVFSTRHSVVMSLMISKEQASASGLSNGKFTGHKILRAGISTGQRFIWDMFTRQMLFRDKFS